MHCKKFNSIIEETENVILFLENVLHDAPCPQSTKREIYIIADEIFSNIVKYSGSKETVITCLAEEGIIRLSFSDSGAAYNPLIRTDMDIAVPVEEKAEGGMGLIIVKKLADEISYEHKEGKNILTVKKYYR